MYDIKTPTLYDVAEDRISQLNQTALLVLLRYRGLLVYGYKYQTSEVEASVYGEFAKSTNLWDPNRTPDFTTRILNTQDGKITFDLQSVSLMNGGYFLSDYPFSTGDIIQFRRNDSMRRFFSISREVQQGVTRSIIRKFEYASYDA